MKALAFLAIIGATVFGCASTQEHTTTDARLVMDDLVAQITTRLDGSPRNIGVTPPEGDAEYGEYLQDEIIAAFLRAHLPGVEVYERSHLNVLLEEAAFGISGLVADETAAEVGKMVGVDAIVVGSVRDHGGSFAVSARLVDTVTARIIGAGSVELPSARGVGQNVVQERSALLGRDFSVVELVLRPDIQPGPEEAVRRITTTDGLWTEYNRSGDLIARGTLQNVTDGEFEVAWIIPEGFTATRYNYHATPDSILARIIVNDYEIGYIELAE